jgi:hypothetical protein
MSLSNVTNMQLGTWQASVSEVPASARGCRLLCMFEICNVLLVTRRVRSRLVQDRRKLHMVSLSCRPNCIVCILNALACLGFLYACWFPVLYLRFVCVHVCDEACICVFWVQLCVSGCSVAGCSSFSQLGAGCARVYVDKHLCFHLHCTIPVPTVAETSLALKVRSIGWCGMGRE